MINGVINVYKEKGFTSHDVVAKMRGILHQKKIGHTGTLDPDAVGVLPVCLGKGTKVVDMLTDKDKTYRTVMLLGVQTDTQDITGTVLKKAEQDQMQLSENNIREAILSFVGEYAQIPPMYSALKVGGKKLCDLARAGITVERKPRQVRIHNIQILDIKFPEVTMEVECSKGTYIRTLCHDIGNKLGCGACMKSLVRTKVGRFRLEDAVTLEEIEKNKDELPFLIPVDELFPYEKCIVKKEHEKLVLNGNPFSEECLVEVPDLENGDYCRVYITDGRFVGIYHKCIDSTYHIDKMFLEK